MNVGLFDLFRRKPPADAGGPLSSDVLRDAIIDAHARGDLNRLEVLLKTHEQQIRRDCLGWNIVPEPIRTDRVRANVYVNALAWLAETLKAAGDDRLWKLLAGDSDNNPLDDWQNTLQESQRLADALEHDRAISRLQDKLIASSKMTGPGMEHFVPITHGLLGHLYFQSARIDLAEGHYETALRLCEQYGDMEGVWVYSHSLYELHRYRGQTEAAADFAILAAAAREKTGDVAGASEFRRQAMRVRAGEPLNRLCAMVEGQLRELHELQPRDWPEGESVQLNFVRNRPNLRTAELLTQRGEHLGREGKLYEALVEFRAAAEVDPYDPHPAYQEALTLMQLQRYDEAAELYAKVESLAPGWFHCRSDRWVARQMVAGRWSHEAFQSTLLAELPPEAMDSLKKLAAIDGAIEAAPDFARLHLARAGTLEALGRSTEAAAACRRGLVCAEDDDDARSRLLVALQSHLDDAQEQVAALRQAASLSATGNLMAAATALLSLRAQGLSP